MCPFFCFYVPCLLLKNNYSLHPPVFICRITNRFKIHYFFADSPPYPARNL